MFAENIFIPVSQLKGVFKYNRLSRLSFLKVFLLILFFHKFDIFVASMGINPIKASALGAASKAGIRCGENSRLFNYCVQTDYNLHEIERNLTIIETVIPSSEIVKTPVLYFSDSDISESARICKENNISDNPELFYIGMHIGSNDFLSAKRWSIKKFDELIEMIKKKYPAINIILFGGRNEYDYSLGINPNNAINLTGKTGLRAAGLIIKKCRAFISNDSGLMHLAAAADIPVIAIFGPTIISKNRPYSDKSTVLTAGLDCQPCYRYNKPIDCKKKFQCIEDISVETVWKELEKIIQPKN